jgi:hypothetical protein
LSDRFGNPEAETREFKEIQHLRDIQLHDPRERRLPTLRRLTAATRRAEHDPKGRFKGFDTDSVSPQLADDLVCAVLTGQTYSLSLFGSMLRPIAVTARCTTPALPRLTDLFPRGGRNLTKRRTVCYLFGAHRGVLPTVL